MQAPCDTTRPVSPGASEASISRRAGTIRAVTSAIVSAPGTPPVT